jgi:hypothetical protein
MIVRFHPRALKELSEASAYYRDIRRELAERLLLAVEQARAHIVELPGAWPPGPGETRRYLLQAFPFQLVYRVRGDEIQIVALAHYKRKPGYSRARLRD